MKKHIKKVKPKLSVGPGKGGDGDGCHPMN